MMKYSVDIFQHIVDTYIVYPLEIFCTYCPGCN